jgi:dUTP pyrophosphatase
MTSTLTLQLLRLPHGQDLPLPTKMTPHSAGFDLYAAVTEPIEILPQQVKLIPCGFKMAVPEGYEAQVRPRSGLSSKHRITLINCVGTIDSDYRGEVMVPLINLSDIPFKITRGERIAQMLIAPIPHVVIKEVQSLDDTSRGTGGFGSTGTK